MRIFCLDSSFLYTWRRFLNQIELWPSLDPGVTSNFDKNLNSSSSKIQQSTIIWIFMLYKQLTFERTLSIWKKIAELQHQPFTTGIGYRWETSSNTIQPTKTWNRLVIHLTSVVVHKEPVISEWWLVAYWRRVSGEQGPLVLISHLKLEQKIMDRGWVNCIQYLSKVMRR